MPAQPLPFGQREQSNYRPLLEPLTGRPVQPQCAHTARCDRNWGEVLPYDIEPADLRVIPQSTLCPAAHSPTSEHRLSTGNF